MMRMLELSKVLGDPLGCKGCQRHMSSGEECYWDRESLNYYCLDCVNPNTLTLKSDATAEAPKPDEPKQAERRTMLKKAKTDYSGQCPWCDGRMAADIDCYCPPLGLGNFTYLCSSCGGAYNKGFQAGKLATEADKAVAAPKPDDGGPAFVATAKCSAEYEDGFQYWEKALSLRGDESAAAIWKWASKDKPFGVDSIIIVKADAMLAERGKGGDDGSD